MEKTIICFDVDGTLIEQNDSGEDTPRYATIQLLHLLYCLDTQIYVWSGSGADYAQRWCEKLGIEKMVRIAVKGDFKPDIAFDDQEVDLGIINVRI